MESANPILFQLYPSKPSKGDLKRQAIIQAGILSLAKDGLEGGVFDRIATRLKIRRSHIVYYYQDLDALFHDVIQWITFTAQRVTVEIIKEKKTPEEQILGIVEGAFRWAADYPAQAKVMMHFYSLGAVSSKHRKLHTQIRETGQARLEALLKTVPGKASAASAGDMACALQAIITGLIIDGTTTDTERDFAQIARRACASVLLAWKASSA